MWGKTVGTLVLAVTMAAVSGCSSSDDEGDAKPAAKPETVSVDEAAATFQDAVTQFGTDGGCLEPEPGTCWEQMQAVTEPARVLRKAMNAEKSVGPGFWTDAYVLIDTMEKGIAVGDDQGATDADTNRPDVFGSAHDLSDWLDEHPIT